MWEELAVIKELVCILVIADGLTRYPEVEMVKGTTAKDNIQAFSEVFSRHGVSRMLHSNNGRPSTAWTATSCRSNSPVWASSTSPKGMPRTLRQRGWWRRSCAT